MENQTLTSLVDIDLFVRNDGEWQHHCDQHCQVHWDQHCQDHWDHHHCHDDQIIVIIIDHFHRWSTIFDSTIDCIL